MNTVSVCVSRNSGIKTAALITCTEFATVVAMLLFYGVFDFELSTAGILQLGSERNLETRHE